MQKRRIILVLLFTLFIKVALAHLFELNNDEVYYWTYTSPLQLSYFDHPPVIGFLLRFTTFNLQFENEFFLRLGPLLCSVVSSYLIFRITLALIDEEAGYYALILFLVSPYCSIIAGLLVMPDAPQLMFWLWSILLMVKILQSSGANRNRILLVLGLSTGLCILSKIHGLVLWPGFLLYLLMFRRDLLKNQFLYYSILLTTILTLPIVFWNIENNFITYRFHSNRVNLFALHPENMLKEIGGEIAYNNPFLIITLIAALIVFKKQAFYQFKPGYSILLFTSLPLIGFVLFISLFNDTLPHWSGPAYATLIPVAAGFLRWKTKEKPITGIKLRMPNRIRYAFMYMALFLFLPVIMLYYLPPSNEKDWNRIGKNDLLLDMSGWKTFGAQMDSLARIQNQGKVKNINSYYIADYWFPAAHIEYYAARPYGHPFIAIGEITAIHHYAWRNTVHPFLKKGDNAYFITVSNYFGAPDPALCNQFDSVLSPILIPQFRNSKPVRNFIIYPMQHYRGHLPESGILSRR